MKMKNENEMIRLLSFAFLLKTRKLQPAYNDS